MREGLTCGVREFGSDGAWCSDSPASYSLALGRVPAGRALLIGRDKGPEHHWTIPLTLAVPCASCAG